jgi:hypothetical protein
MEQKESSGTTSAHVNSKVDVNLDETYSGDTQTEKDDELTLVDLIRITKEWWRYFLSKWVIIVIVGLLGGVLGFFYAKTKKVLYKAELTFALEESGSGGLGGALGLASQFGLDFGGGGAGGGVFSVDNLLQLMKSRSMVEKALLTEVSIDGNNQTLAEYYIAYNKMREGWENDPNMKSVRFLSGADRSKFTMQQDSILGLLYEEFSGKSLTVEKIDKKSTIIAMNVISGNELFSKYFTTVLAEEVSDFYIETKTKKSAQNLAILQHQTDSVRRELNSAISGVASSSDANPNANSALQRLRVPSQKRQFDVQVNQAILSVLVQNLELAKVSLRKETPLIQVIDSPILPLKNTKLSKRNSVIVGGILAGFLILAFLAAKKILDEMFRKI